MNKFRFTTLAALALAGTAATGVAQARDADVRWSVTIGTPYYALPAPVYVQPQPVYVAPDPMYYYEPAPVYRRPVPVYRGVQRHHAPTYWDRDGDGIPNRYDTHYNPYWDRDRDGVPNRWDRHPRDGGRR
jgi:hypothetical protein